MKKQLFDVSFRAYFPNGNKVDHHATIELKEIPKWIDCYKFTHKECTSITIKIWYKEDK